MPGKAVDPLPLVIAKAIATHLVATPYNKRTPNQSLKCRFVAIGQIPYFMTPPRKLAPYLHVHRFSFQYGRP